MKKRGPSYTVGGKVNWGSPYGAQHGGSFKNWASIWFNNPLLDVYPDNSINQNDTGPPVLIAVLFTIARTCKQPVYWAMNDQRGVLYVHSGIGLGHKQHWNDAVSNSMDFETVALSEVSHRVRQVYNITYTWRASHSSALAWKTPRWRSLVGCSPWVAKSWTRLSA